MPKSLLRGYNARMRFFLLILLAFGAGNPAFAGYPLSPKVVVVFVVDQMRADQLALAPLKGGFRKIIAEGAYFPQAEYGLSACMTAPGHATILTGSFPRTNGVTNNVWIHPETLKKAYCVEDPVDKISPRSLNGTTVGDELKLARPNSRVISLSLKDRAAVYLGGHGPDLAIWFDEKTNQFTTSSFYRPTTEALPSWVVEVNAKIQKAQITKASFVTLQGVRALEQLVLAAISGLKIGQGAGTDLLAVSFSSHDYLGHKVGPNRPQMREHLMDIDRAVGGILERLPHPRLVVLTSDHGIPHSNSDMARVRYPATKFTTADIEAEVAKTLEDGFGKKSWLVQAIGTGVYLNNREMSDAHADRMAIEKAIKQRLLNGALADKVASVWTSSEIESNALPEGVLAVQLRNSYYPGRSPNVQIVPKPYFFEGDKDEVEHMTGYAYDRTVPLVLAGPAIKHGVFSGGRVIDLAPTLAFLLGIVPPALSEGRVLGEVIGPFN